MAFLIPGFADGGAQRQFASLVNEIKRYRQFEVHVIYFHEGVNFHLLELDGIYPHKIESVSFYDPRNILRINRVIRRFRIQVLFSWMHSCDIYSFFLAIRNPKLNWIIAERLSAYPSKLVYKLRRFLGRFASSIIANSEAGRLYWLQVGYKKVSVVGNMLLYTSGRVARASRKPRVLYAGRLEPQKSIIAVCKSFAEVARRRPDVEFIVIGDGSLIDEVHRIIKDAGVGNFCRLPFQSEIYAHFAAASVFVNASKYEGLPNTVIENVSMGTRVVLSRIPEHEAIVGKDYPYLVDMPLDSLKLGHAIEAALQDIETADDYRFAETVLSEMSTTSIGQRYAQILSEIAE